MYKSYDFKSDAFSLECSSDYIHIESCNQFSVLSSAVLNGGLRDVRHIVNLRVPKSGEFSVTPKDTLSEFCSSSGWGRNCVGMMTAASMNSLSVKEQFCDDVYIAVCITVGLSNSRCAGDVADIQNLFSGQYQNGTINIILLTDAALTPAAMTETVMTVSEAKCEAMRQFDVRSTVSGKIATGTGTDAIVVASAGRRGIVEYCGKHTLFGEVAATLTINALMDSMEWYHKRK